MSEADDDPASDRMVEILTTVHFTLQTERAATISEANGRTTLYLTSVSASLVALGFIAQATELGPGFYLFAFVLFAVLSAVGIVTFTRVVQTGTEDWTAARSIERIRRFYVEAAPGIERWLVVPVADDDRAPDQAFGGRGRWQVLLTTASMVAVVNCALIGVLVGLAAFRFATPTMATASAVGAVACALAAALHLRHQQRVWAESMPGRRRADRES